MTLPLTGVGATGGAVAYNAAILAEPSLVSYWRMDASAGTSETDRKGANTGTYSGTFTVGQAGALTVDSDAAVSFAGGKMAAGNAASLQLSTGSFECWVTTTDSGGAFRGVMVKDNAVGLFG
jgi:hypothetical protein